MINVKEFIISFTYLPFCLSQEKGGREGVSQMDDWQGLQFVIRFHPRVVCHIAVK